MHLSLDDLSDGDVVYPVSHSTINYKDALAATGKGRILRRYPLVGGIDLAGTVVSSASDDFDEASRAGERLRAERNARRRLCGSTRGCRPTAVVPYPRA